MFEAWALGAKVQGVKSGSMVSGSVMQGAATLSSLWTWNQWAYFESSVEIPAAGATIASSLGLARDL